MKKYVKDMNNFNKQILRIQFLIWQQENILFIFLECLFIVEN
jgi:hypothetical protein